MKLNRTRLVTVSLLLFLSGDFSIEVERNDSHALVKITKEQVFPIGIVKELLN